MSSPVKVTIGHAELAASHSVSQIVEVIEPHARETTLLRLLSKYHASRKNRVLCFALYKKEADRLERFLQAKGWKCVAIHGDMTQDARTRAFNAFKSGEIPLLVATDVAARGLDVSSVCADKNDTAYKEKSNIHSHLELLSLCGLLPVADPQRGVRHQCHVSPHHRGLRAPHW